MFFYIEPGFIFFFQFETNLSVQLAKKLQLIVFVEEMESLRVKKENSALAKNTGINVVMHQLLVSKFCFILKA